VDEERSLATMNSQTSRHWVLLIPPKNQNPRLFGEKDARYQNPEFIFIFSHIVLPGGIDRVGCRLRPGGLSKSAAYQESCHSGIGHTGVEKKRDFLPTLG
jgi:hypothetical protein